MGKSIRGGSEKFESPNLSGRQKSQVLASYLDYLFSLNEKKEEKKNPVKRKPIQEFHAMNFIGQ